MNVCPKCGNLGEACIEYHPDWSFRSGCGAACQPFNGQPSQSDASLAAYGGLGGVEHLLLTCVRCGYKEAVPVVDVESKTESDLLFDIPGFKSASR